MKEIVLERVVESFVNTNAQERIEFSVSELCRCVNSAVLWLVSPAVAKGLSYCCVEVGMLALQQFVFKRFPGLQCKFCSKTSVFEGQRVETPSTTHGK